MTVTDIKSAILDSLAKVAPESDPAELSPDQNIRRALDIDSYDFLTFLIGLSESIGVEVPEADYGKLGTLNEMISYFSAKAK